MKNPLLFLDDFNFYRGIKLAGQLIAQNIFQQQQLLKNYGRSSVIINQMTPLADEKTLTESDGFVSVLWVANLKALKRPELFIELARRLKNSNINQKYQMIMIGRIPASYKDLLENAKQEISTFQYLGELSQEEVNDALSKPGILINTSVYEGFSNTFVQAWMRKVPVISMNSDPNATLSVHKLGFLTPTMDELVEKTALLLENDSLRREIGEKARCYAIESYSLEQNMPILLSLLENEVQ